MSEKRFLSFIFTESILLIILAFCLFILPKVTDLTFGLLLCLVLMIYGGYKIILSFLVRNIEKHYILNIFNSVILFVTGIVLFFVRNIDMTIITSILGIYFVLHSISMSAFYFQVKNIFQNKNLGCFCSIINFLFGIILVMLMPSMWIGGALIGLSFLINGVTMVNMYLSKKYSL